MKKTSEIGRHILQDGKSMQLKIETSHNQSMVRLTVPTFYASLVIWMETLGKPSKCLRIGAIIG